jgi:enterochelin esterase-like enzyme
VAFTPASQQCGTDGPLHYCIYRDRRGSNGDVLYHMHGRNLDERIWNDDTYFTAMLQHEWQQGQALPPTVVTLSYGPSWLLTPRGRKADSGLLNDLMARLPVIEARVGRPRRRLLMGESMGGLNVLIAGLSYPDRFARVAALCPGVYATSPSHPSPRSGP